MNQRIVDLANKANQEVGYTFKLEDAKQIHDLMEKFAEILIKECVDVCDDADYLGSAIGDKILKHFGVE